MWCVIAYLLAVRGRRRVDGDVRRQLALVKHRARLARLDVDDELAKKLLRAHRLEGCVELIGVKVGANGKGHKVAAAVVDKVDKNFIIRAAFKHLARSARYARFVARDDGKKVGGRHAIPGVALLATRVHVRAGDTDVRGPVEELRGRVGRSLLGFGERRVREQRARTYHSGKRVRGV